MHARILFRKEKGRERHRKSSKQNFLIEKKKKKEDISVVIFLLKCLFILQGDRDCKGGKRRRNCGGVWRGRRVSRMSGLKKKYIYIGRFSIVK